jgi:hypothetical protein
MIDAIEILVSQQFTQQIYTEQYPGPYHPPHTLFIKIEKLLIDYVAYSIKVVRRLPKLNIINEDVHCTTSSYSLNPQSSVRLL